jgi:LPXTG-motif cell wall-anchored protein
MVEAVRDQWLIALGIVAVLVAAFVIWRSRRR